tara:strand:+ start:970 stop:1425 length:456 start_codon:yes stop_codon:yes gene_type:complete
MFKKILIIFVIPVLLCGCGYSTLFSTKNNQNINIKVLESSGDRDINNFLISNLKKYSGNQGRTFFVSIDTNYSVSDNSKNLEGSVSNYQLLAVVKFQIKSNNLNKTITIQEDIIVKNLSDNFEKKNYEKSIKRSFSNTIATKLMLQLSSIQ